MLPTHPNTPAHSVMHPSIYGGQYMPPHHFGIGYGLSMHSGSDKDAGNKVVMSDTHPASESPAALIDGVGDGCQQTCPRCAAGKVEMSDTHRTLEGPSSVSVALVQLPMTSAVYLQLLMVPRHIMKGT